MSYSLYCGTQFATEVTLQASTVDVCCVKYPKGPIMFARSFLRLQRASLMDPPEDLLGGWSTFTILPENARIYIETLQVQFLVNTTKVVIARNIA